MKIHGWEGPNAATKPLVPPCLPCHKEWTKKAKHKTLSSPKSIMDKNKTLALFLFICYSPKGLFSELPAIWRIPPFWESRSPLREMERTAQQGSMRKALWAAFPMCLADTCMCYAPLPLSSTFFSSNSPCISPLHEDTLGLYTTSSSASTPCNPTLFP